MRHLVGSLLRRLGNAALADHRSELERRDRKQLHSIVERLDRLDARLTALDATLAKQIARRLDHLDQGTGALLRRLYLDPADLAPPYDLLAQRFRIASQNQEDGLTLAILRRAGIETRRFAELGCGSNGGNAGFLAQDCGWSGLMVDARSSCIASIRGHFDASRVTAVRAWVTRENVNGLLEHHGVTGEIDLLSIDLDGNDYWIWDALIACRPRVVITEFNSLFGPDQAVVVPYDPEFDRHTVGAPGHAYCGASLAALTRLGARKGYRLVVVEPRGCNAYFVRNDVGPDLKACAVQEAYRSADKFLGQEGERARALHAFIRERSLPLVEVG